MNIKSLAGRICGAVAGVSVALPAAAQDLAPITGMLTKIETAMTGPIGIAVCTIALVGTGFMCLMGRLNWSWFIAVLVGIVLVASAPTIVGGFFKA